MVTSEFSKKKILKEIIFTCVELIDLINRERTNKSVEVQPSKEKLLVKNLSCSIDKLRRSNPERIFTPKKNTFKENETEIEECQLVKSLMESSPRSQIVAQFQEYQELWDAQGPE